MIILFFPLFLGLNDLLIVYLLVLLLLKLSASVVDEFKRLFVVRADRHATTTNLTVAPGRHIRGVLSVSPVIPRCE